MTQPKKPDHAILQLPEEISVEECQDLVVSLYRQAQNKGMMSSSIQQELRPVVMQWRLESFVGLLKTPYWVQGNTLKLSYAAMDQDQFYLDFSEYGYVGHVQGDVTLFDGPSTDDPGLLMLNWHADTYNPHGWWLGIFIQNHKDPICNYWLGQDSQNQGILLSTGVLHFDPRKTPFRYIIYPG